MRIKIRLKKQNGSGKLNKKKYSDDLIEYRSFTKRKPYFYEIIHMSIKSTDMLTLSYRLSIQILLGALKHKSDNTFAGAHCDGIFVGFLVMAWVGERVWVGL